MNKNGLQGVNITFACFYLILCILIVRMPAEREGVFSESNISSSDMDELIEEPKIIRTAEVVEAPVEEIVEVPVEEQCTGPGTGQCTDEETVYFDVPLEEALQDHIFSLCERYGVDPEIVIAMIQQESDFDSLSIGDGGNSLGLMQIQPKWHQERMDNLGCYDLLDPYQNVAVGIDYLSELMDSGMPLEWVLMAYNGGISYADTKFDQGVTSAYVASVMAYKGNLKGDNG